MCGIQSQEIAKGWAIFVGSSIRGHTKVAMGSNGVDLDKARENDSEIFFNYTTKRGFWVVIKKQFKPMKMDITL